MNRDKATSIRDVFTRLDAARRAERVRRTRAALALAAVRRKS